VGTFSFFFANSYAVSAWVLGVAGVLLAASFLVRRPFCEALCPIGAVADLAYRLEKRWTAGRQERGAAGSGETS
jgi:polyferredoxin